MEAKNNVLPSSRLGPLPSGRVLLRMAVAAFIVSATPYLDTRGVIDEAWLSMPAYTLITEGRLGRPAFETAKQIDVVIPPLFTLLLAPVYAVFGFALLPARWLTVTFGIAVVLGTYALGREIFDERVGGLAALFAAVDNLLILAARTVRTDVVVATFILGALWLAWRALLTDRPRVAALAGISLGLGMLTHPIALSAVPALVLIWARTGNCPRGRTAMVLLLFACVLTVLPCVAYVVAKDAASGFELLQAQVRNRALGTGTGLRYAMLAELQQRYRDFLQFPYRVHVLAALLGAMLWSLWGRGSSNRIRTVWGVTLIILASFVWMRNKEVRYFVLAAPFYSVGLAAAIVSQLNAQAVPASSARRRQRVLVAGIAVYVISQLGGTLTFLYRHRNTDYGEFTALLRAAVPRDARVYGALDFWYAFAGSPYTAYAAVMLPEALATVRPDTVLIGDRSMMIRPEWTGLRASLEKLVESDGSLIGVVDNWFYGTIRIYALDTGGTEYRRIAALYRSPSPTVQPAGE